MSSKEKPHLLDVCRLGSEAENLKQTISAMVVGQDEAINQIVNIYQMSLVGMCPTGRPLGNFLFLGPTGSGKTRIVEATAEGLVGTAKAVIKIDCAEFQHGHEIAKLVGSPPGYLGHRETHPLLSPERLYQYHTERVQISFLLFDEIEKASDSLWNLLLGIMDKASLTLGDNRKVDFSRALIFMTSNLGAREMDSVMNRKLGFLAGKTGMDLVGRGDKMNGKLTEAGMRAARSKFTPEFMNRLDKVVVFKSLGEQELRQILEIELGYLQDRLSLSGRFVGGGFNFKLSDDAKELLLREGTDPRYGARHLKRVIELKLAQPFSNLIATKQIIGNDRVVVSCESGELHFSKESSLSIHSYRSAKNST